MEIIRNGYIVFSKVFNLGRIPLDIKGLREPFKNIFSSESCFEDYFKNKDKKERPFIKGLSSICFNPQRFTDLQSNNFIGTYSFERFLKKEAFPDKKSFLYSDYFYQEYENSQRYIFGFDKEFTDQRFNHLFFELKNPPNVRVTFDGLTVAQGRVFLHIYPSGFIVLKVALNLSKENYTDISEFFGDLQKVAPWTRKKSEWFISGKGYNPQEWVSKISSDISSSLFEKTKVINSSKWFYSTKLITNVSKEKLQHLSFEKYSSSIENVHNPLNVDYQHNGEYKYFDDYNKIQESNYILISRNGCSYCMNKNSTSSKYYLKRFWKVEKLIEFAFLKKVIYENYNYFLEKEILKLKEFRLNPVEKIKNDDYLRVSAYKGKIPQFLLALDNFTKAGENSFYQKIYSEYSNSINIDKTRDKLKKNVILWEGEVEKWNPNSTYLISNILKPLKQFFGL